MFVFGFRFEHTSTMKCLNNFTYESNKSNIILDSTICVMHFLTIDMPLLWNEQTVIQHCTHTSHWSLQY